MDLAALKNLDVKDLIEKIKSGGAFKSFQI